MNELEIMNKLDEKVIELITSAKVKYTVDANFTKVIKVEHFIDGEWLTVSDMYSNFMIIQGTIDDLQAKVNLK